ncbi:MCE family protein [Nocardia sp. NEAU-351]|uniref:MCE family protein n=2 Tax=Nocardia bovistercoris TaxID=2785916 RepID=A0A931N4V5_9NOCA|nr:MCE family protein [Nocardia bovistercoris]
MSIATGCGFQPAQVPIPGSGPGGPTYRLHVEFADILNLPQGAPVIADGVEIGQLTGLRIVDPAAGVDGRPGRPGHVVADLAIRDSVRLASGTTAGLRQATPLGAVYIALTTPTNATSNRLESDATIPLADTDPAPPIEDILAGLAAFVNGGAITDLQHIVGRFNAILPDDTTETARVASDLGADLTDLADHLDSVDTVLNGMRATIDEGILRNATTIDELLTPWGVQHTTDGVNASIQVLYMLTALGPIGDNAVWAAPLVNSLDGAARAVVPMLFGAHPLDAGTPSNLGKLTDLIQNKVIPFTEHGPKIDVLDVTVADDSTSSRSAQTDRILDTLRMIGVLR